MNANVKIVLVLGAIVLAVFGITVISKYTGRAEADKVTISEGVGDAAAFETVRYGVNQIFYNPKSEDRALREFPGYFEVNDQEHTVTYWFHNPNPVPVDVTAVKRSCSACTSARLAVFPPKIPNPDVDLAGRAALGVAGAEAIPIADLEHRLATYPAADWKLLDFDHPEVRQVVPPAGADGSPTWVAMQLKFKVRQKGPKLLEATLGFKTASQTTTLETIFKVGFIGMPRFEVLPAQIDFREMDESTPSKSESIIYWSSTVPQKELAPPKCSEPASEPFLTFSEPIPLTENEIGMLLTRNSRPDAPAKVLGGYRVVATLHRKNPAPKPGQPLELDIGPLEKSFVVLGDGNEADPPVVRVKATVVGLVKLFNGNSVDLGSFSSKDGTSKSFTLQSDRLDLGLELAKEFLSPKVLEVELEAPTNESGRREWTLKVKIKGGATSGNFSGDSVVVLRDVATRQLVRFPVKGTAFIR